MHLVLVSLPNATSIQEVACMSARARSTSGTAGRLFMYVLFLGHDEAPHTLFPVGQGTSSRHLLPPHKLEFKRQLWTWSNDHVKYNTSVLCRLTCWRAKLV